MKLTTAQIKTLKCPPAQKTFKKSDGEGLYIVVKPNGSKLWRYLYTFAKSEQTLALGPFPSVSLADARKAHQIARSLKLQGINPMDERRERKNLALIEQALFGDVALTWWEKEKVGWSEGNAKKLKGYIDKELKQLSKSSLGKVNFAIISNIMIAIEASGTPKKATNVLSLIRRVFNYAKAKNLIDKNPAEGLVLRELLSPMPKTKPRAAILDIDQLKVLIEDVDANESGSYCTNQALKLIPRLFLRPGEIRSLKWSYVKFEQKKIYIPKEIMKSVRDFIVPLSTQVIKQLIEIKKHTGYSEFVFPNARDSSKYISKNVLTDRLRVLGYTADIMSAHGFRSTASTILSEELEINSDVIETQLAHLVGNETRRAYIRGLYIKQRIHMMQAWSDYLDELKAK